MKNIDIEVLRLYYKWTFQHVSCHRNFEVFSFGLGIQVQFKFSSQDPQLRSDHLSYETLRTTIQQTFIKTSCHPLIKTKTHILKPREIFVQIKAASPFFETLLTFLCIQEA